MVPKSARNIWAASGPLRPQFYLLIVLFVFSGLEADETHRTSNVFLYSPGKSDCQKEIRKNRRGGTSGINRIMENKTIEWRRVCRNCRIKN